MLPTVDVLQCYLGNLVLAFEPQCIVMGGRFHDYHQVGTGSQCVVEGRVVAVSGHAQLYGVEVSCSLSQFPVSCFS